MYEIWYILRDEWGKIQYVKRPGFRKKVQSAVKLAAKLGKNSYVKKYGQIRPVWINNSSLNEMVQDHD